jgi:hypothetical protein
MRIFEMKKIALVLLLVGGLGVMSVGMVQASPIVVGGPWYAFEFGFPPTFAVGVATHDSADPGIPPWTYDAATATSVKITDSYTAGDMFSLYDFNVFVGTTSTVPTTALGTTNPTPDVDYLDPLLSHGLFILPAGNHSLTIQTYQVYAGAENFPPPVGVAFFRVDANAAPLPPSAWLLGSGLLGLVGWRRFRKS